MSLTRITITDPVTPPDGVAVGGTMIFLLSQPATDNGIVVPREVRAAIADGAFTAQLWPTSRGNKPEDELFYTVRVVVPPPSGEVRETNVRLGQFTLDERSGTRSLKSLLDPDDPPELLLVSPDVYGAQLVAAEAFYGSVAAGLSASVDGAYFFVVTDGETRVAMWRRESGAAVPVAMQVEVTA